MYNKMLMTAKVISIFKPMKEGMKRKNLKLFCGPEKF